MGSRLKENPDKTFYWFFQASCPIAKDKDPGLLFQFPDDFTDEECLQSLPKFCFPYDIERVRDGVAVQHFTFTLTDMEGCQRFGFCRLTSSSQTCLCILRSLPDTTLSYLPWFEVFYKLLNNLADYMIKGQMSETRELLTALYKHPVPLINSSNTLHQIPYFLAPDPKTLPSIPESRNLTELIVAVDVGNLLQLYSSMLFERRVLICCSKLSTLTACVHACCGMLFPMYWQHIFIPVLPPHLLDYCCAPMPYLIGVHSSLMERVRSRALEDVVIFNVDTNTMESPHNDLKKLPADVVTALKVRLKRQAMFTGSGVPKAFLKAQVLLFGAYKDALQYSSKEPVSFNEELFLTHKSPSMRQFLESAIHLQFFKQFIDARLEMLNRGKEPDDLFEEEILPECQQKGGGSLILTVKSKAQMCKNVTCHSKLKNLISSKGQKQVHTLQRGESVCGTHSYRFTKSDCLQSRLPITQHYGKSRPRRPTRKSANQQGEEPMQDNSSSWEEESHIGSASEELTEEGEFSVMADLEEMDLLGEIFDTLNTQSATEPGMLYSTRSLDVFTSDCTDFISRRSLATPSQESLSLSTGNTGSLMSWEEGHEGGLDIEETEPPSDEQVRNMRDGVRESYSMLKDDEQLMDLGRLVEDLVDLKQELEEELNGNCKKTSMSLEDVRLETSRSSGTNQEISCSPEKCQETTSKNNHPESLPQGDFSQEKQHFTNEQENADKEDEEQERCTDQSTSKVLFKVALFQVKSYQTRGSPETVRTNYDHKILDTSLKISPRGPGALGVTATMKTEDLNMNSPTTSNLSDTKTEDKVLPLPKVSELKKRFEQ